MVMVPAVPLFNHAARGEEERVVFVRRLFRAFVRPEKHVCFAFMLLVAIEIDQGLRWDFHYFGHVHERVLTAHVSYGCSRALLVRAGPLSPLPISAGARV